MRNEIAKQIRRDVYGDNSLKDRRLYPTSKAITKHLKGKTVKEQYRGKTVKMTVSYIIADPLRQEYQAVKKQYNSLTRKERGMI